MNSVWKSPPQIPPLIPPPMLANSDECKRENYFLNRTVFEKNLELDSSILISASMTHSFAIKGEKGDPVSSRDIIVLIK